MTGHQLILMRHAHAEPGGVDDHSRALTPAGRLAARGKRDRLLGHHVQHVLCSTAVRAVQTLDQLDLGVPGELEDELYGAGVDDLVQRIRRVPDDVRRVLVIGHLPTIGELATWLAGRAAPVGPFDPASVAVIEVEVPFAAMEEGDGALEAFLP